MAEAAWVTQQLHGQGGQSVGSVIPPGFERYVRILHPATRRGDGRRSLRWNEVARWGGGIIGPSTQFLSLALNQAVEPGRWPWRSGPLRGSLSAEDAGALVELARVGTTTPESCWFCLWEGYGWLPEKASHQPNFPTAELGPTLGSSLGEVLAKVEFGGLKYYMYHGDIGQAAVLAQTSHQSPNAWWPSDHRWCVVSHPDLDSTYVGAAIPLSRAISTDGRLESVPVQLTDETIGRLDGHYTAALERMADSLLDVGTAKLDTPFGLLEARLGTKSAGLMEVVIVWNRVTGDHSGTATSVGREGRRTDIVGLLEQGLIGLVIG